MISLTTDIIQSAGVGALALAAGMCLTRHVGWLRRYCIPSPVSGGLLFSLLTLLLYACFDIELTLDATIKDLSMLLFFTCVGFQSDLKVIRSGGRPLLIMLLLLVVIISMQNGLSLVLASALGLDPLVGMAAGSISMTGGHGTSAGFCSVLQQMGLRSAGTITMACATFGLIAGSMLGGPLAEHLIERHGLSDQRTGGPEMAEQPPAEAGKEQSAMGATASFLLLLLVMAGGSYVTRLIALAGITFPSYFGALLLAVFVRNVMGLIPLGSPQGDRKVRADALLNMTHIGTIGTVSLNVFLGIAMASLRLWELHGLALPLLLILAVQVLVLALFVYCFAFRWLGRDYDAAVYCAGICGFGLGATPNAMANMSAVCQKYHYTLNPFLLIPIVGAMFVDLINTTLITLFLHIL